MSATDDGASAGGSDGAYGSRILCGVSSEEKRDDGAENTKEQMRHILYHTSDLFSLKGITLPGETSKCG